MKSCVYCITCLVNGKRYVGKTNDPERRWSEHRDSPKGYMLIHFAIRKHGSENFKFEVVAECASEDEAFEAEHKLIVEWGTNDREKGYNLNEGGKRSFRPSEETRRKMSESAQKRPPISEETRQKFADRARERSQHLHMTGKRSPRSYVDRPGPNLGKKFSEEHKRKISEAMKARHACK